MVSIHPGPQSNPPHREFLHRHFSQVRRTFALAGLLVAVAIAFTPTPAAAGSNLLANPEFPPSALLPWEVDAYGSTEWSSNDAHGVSGSGSIRIIDDKNFYFPFVNSECLPIVGGAQVDASASFRGVANIDSAATVHYRIAIYSSTNCADLTGLVELKSAKVKPGTSWFSIPLTGTAPAGARSMRMRIGVSTGTDLGSFLTVEADSVSLTYAGALPDNDVFRDGFESGGLTAWSLVSGS